MNKKVIILIVVLLVVCLFAGIAIGDTDSLQEQSANSLAALEERFVDDVNLAVDSDDVCLIKKEDSGQDELCAKGRKSVSGCRLEGNLLIAASGTKCRIGIKESEALARAVNLTLVSGTRVNVGLGLVLQDGKVDERLDKEYGRDEAIEITVPRGGWLFINGCVDTLGTECVLTIRPPTK